VGCGVGVGVGVGRGTWHNSILKRTTYQGSFTKITSRWKHNLNPFDDKVPENIDVALRSLFGSFGPE
jgi:hypothetical protein